MNLYDIEIDYTTGDSFGSERKTELLCNPTSINNAKENLKRIKEHYVRCKDNYNTDERYELELVTNEGTRKISPFWIGYFETLHGAKVVVDEDPDMKFEF